MSEIFVFGSNLAGRHGRGSAYAAWRHHGAKRGIGLGHVGNSYAIPTKDRELKTLPLTEIQKFVGQFLAYASAHPEHTFNVVKIGCGLAGYQEHQIAPMFRHSPDNVKLPEGWKQP